jgi:hypothetical protein
MADPINFQDKLKAKQSEQDALELHMEGIDDRLQIVAVAIKEMIEAGHSNEDIAKTLQFFANAVERSRVDDVTEGERDVSAAVNDDKSPLIDLIRCVVCNETMKLEKSSPDAEGRDIIQYRCGLCNRIERMRLFRRSRDSMA